MSNIHDTDARAGERGAVSIKAVLIFVVIGIIAFVVIKIAPEYVDERQVVYKIDDLANKSAVRNSKDDDIRKAIELIRKEYNLPENSISMVSREAGKVKITVNYQHDIDLLVTTYQWKVDRTINGKDL